jgi:hypothetical protein
VELDWAFIAQMLKVQTILVLSDNQINLGLSLRYCAVTHDEASRRIRGDPVVGLGLVCRTTRISVYLNSLGDMMSAGGSLPLTNIRHCRISLVATHPNNRDIWRSL